MTAVDFVLSIMYNDVQLYIYIYTYNLYYIYNIIYVLYIAIIILYPSIQGDDEATMMYVPLAIKHGWLENP